MFVDGSNEVSMFDEISRFEAVPICEGLDLICFQIKIEEAEC